MMDQDFENHNGNKNLFLLIVIGYQDNEGKHAQNHCIYILQFLIKELYLKTYESLFIK